jgi:glutamate synthase (NADPH/NADH) large chain
MALPSNYPARVGLYDPANEHDACGVAMVATLNKIATHEIVDKALTALRNLEHRGASGAEPDSGDGAGILIRVPDAFYRAVVDFDLPAEGSYATGIAFVAQGAEVRSEIAKIVAEEGLVLLGWRDLPVNSTSLGKTALSVMPKFFAFKSTKTRSLARICEK